MLCFVSPRDDITALAFTCDGKILFQAILNHKKSKRQINVINFSTGELLYSLPCFASIDDLFVSPDNQILIAHSQDIITQIWDWQNSLCLKTFHTSSEINFPFYSSKVVCQHSIDDIASLPSGQIIASVAERKGIYQVNQTIWDIQTGDRLHDFGIHQRDIYNNYAPMSKITKDASLLAIPKGNDIEIWHIDSQKLCCVLYGDNSAIESFVISDNGNTIVSYARNQTVKVWKKSN